MADRYEALVVGGGPSGSIAAKTLSDAGVKVLLIEKDFKRIKPCGGATPSTSFEAFGLSQEQIVRKIKSISAVSPAGGRIDISLKGGYLAIVERGNFDHSLRKQAERSGADLAEAEFIGIKEIQKKMCITVCERGRERHIVSDFLIAADGVNSRIAKAMGLEALPGIYTIQEEIDMYSAGDFSGHDSCEFWFGFSHAPDFYSWVFPKKDYIDIGTGSRNGKSLKSILKSFKSRRQIYKDGRQKVYRLPLRCRDSLVKGRILFVGDAAGLVMPLSYEGIYYAMKSGEMAAEAVIKENPGDYEKQWNKKISNQFKLMERIKEYFYRDDRGLEQICILHKSKVVQDVSMKLMLKKALAFTIFSRYASFFRKFLN